MSIISNNVLELTVVTVSTDKKFYYPHLVESCIKNNKHLVTLGMGEKWQGYNWKFSKMLDYLHTLNEDTIVCFVDGYDVICCKDLNKLADEFIRLKNNHKCKIIVGYEKNRTINSLFFGTCKNKNLNSGTYIGYNKDLKKIIQEIYNLNPDNKADDQVLMTKYCNSNPNDIYIDVNNELFLTIFKPLQDASKYISIKDNKTYNNNNNNNNNQPFFIHTPGNGFLDNVIIKLGYNAPDENIKKLLVKNILYKTFGHFIEWIQRYIIFIIVAIIIILYAYYIIFKYNIKENIVKSINPLKPKT